VDAPVDPPKYALASAGLMLALLLPALLREFGWRWLPLVEVAVALAGSWAMWRVGLATQGAGWLMFAWGGLAFGVVLAVEFALCLGARRILRGDKESG
jgi:hypothetical protein